MAPNVRRGAAATATPLRPMSSRLLPEEAGDHVDDLAAPRVDQQGVVPVAHPDVTRGRIGQAVIARVVEPVALAVIARPQAPTDLERRVTPAERIVIEAEVEPRTVMPAIILPVVVL